MKYCKNCGQELPEEADFCTNCGEQCYYRVEPTHQPQANANNNSTLKNVALAFMIIATVTSAAMLIPLCWCIPMTVSYSKKIKAGEPVSTGFKICTLIFVNVVAGVLMLVDNQE